MVVRTLGVLTVNKLFALFFGPVGITFLSHFQNVLRIMTLLQTDGIFKGVIRFISGDNISDVERRKYTSAGYLMSMLVVGVLFIALILSPSTYFKEFYPEGKRIYFLIIVLISVLVINTNQFFLAIIQSYRRFNVFAKVGIANVVIITISVVIGIQSGILYEALWAVGIGHVFVLIVTIIIVKRQTFQHIYLIVNKSLPFKELYGFVIMALSTFLCGALADFVVRLYAIDLFGALETGYWQALVKLSDNLKMVFVSTIGVVFYPTVSAYIANNQKSELKKFIWKFYQLNTLGLIVLFVVIYLFKSFIITLLFSDSFVPATEYMVWQLPGDFFSMLSIPLMYLFYSQKRVKAFVLIEVAGLLVYMLFIFVLVPIFQMKGLILANMVKAILVFLAVFFLQSKIFKKD